MRKNIVFLTLLLMGIPSFANKPVKVKSLLKDVRMSLKHNRDQEKQEKVLLENFSREDLQAKEKADMLFACAQLNQSINDQENLKLYLKQKYDTVRFFSSILKINDYLLRCDSLEQTISKKPKHRKHGQYMIAAYRSNLLNGGKWFLQQGKPAEAYPYFSMYLRHPREAMFANNPDFSSDTQLSKVSYWATLAGYNANQPESVLRHIDYAIASVDSTLRPSLMEYKANSQRAMGKVTDMLGTLRSGVRFYPTHDYFYLHLMEHFLSTDSLEEGILLSDSLAKHVGDRSIYAFGKSQMYFAAKRWDDCILASNHAIQLDSTFADAYYNKSVSYLNQAKAFNATIGDKITSARLRRDRVRLSNLYQMARTPMERFRELRPLEMGRWGKPLYDIYLNLNLEKEFSEIESLLNAK